MNVAECVSLAKQHNKTIQGNMDTAALYGSDESIRQQVDKQLATFRDINYIANLGQGIWPDISPQKVQVYV